MSIIEMPEQQAKAHSDELSFNAQLEGDAVAGTPTLDWPGVGGEGPHDSLAITRKPVNEPQWVIKTDSEVYIDTLGTYMDQPRACVRVCA